MVKVQYDAVDGEQAFKAAFVAPGLFEQTHHLCEISNALVYYITNPDEMHDLIKYLTEWELELAEGICSNLHPDALFHHDDWGGLDSTFMSPAMFDEFLLEPYTVRAEENGETVGKGAYIQVALESLEEIAEFMNDVQEIFDAADEWERKIHDLMLEHAGMDRLLQVTSEFLQNPMTVTGLDFTFVAEAGSEYLPPRARLYTDDGLNMEYVNALLQNETYRDMADTHEYVMFSAYISGCRSMNRNLFVDGKATHRLVLTECRSEITLRVICVLDILVEKLEYLLAHEAEEEDPDRDMEQIFVRILSDRTADYMQVSRELSELGWSGNHEYMCLILQITYLNQQNLSTKAICRYIKKKFEDSVSFLYQDEIVAFFDLTRLGKSQEEVAGKLVYFIRDTYLKAGYSRVMTGHMNLRRQYVQAKTALDVGSRKKPYLWIHYFGQVALTYILEQATRRLPGTMICHEGLLELKKHDEENQTQYMETLRVYLEQHLSATQAARELFIHRSTFLYRLDRIKEILQSELDDPEEIFYLELSFRLLEQEREKE